MGPYPPRRQSPWGGSSHLYPLPPRPPASVLPTTSQGELHKYCTASNEAEVRFNGQSQKTSDTPAHQLPDNETNCGWAPFGEFSTSPPPPAAGEAGSPPGSSTGDAQSRWLAWLPASPTVAR